MKESEKKRFRELTNKYGLAKDDFWFSPQGWAIISRRGIEKIQSKMGLFVTYEVVSELTDIESDKITIKATATNDPFYLAGSQDKIGYDKPLSANLPDVIKIETYGESNPENTKGGAKSYPVAMAEKRALARIILKASDFYQLQVLGEDEAGGTEHGVSQEPTQGLQRMAGSPANRTK
jgi:hypothetical protein